MYLQHPSACDFKLFTLLEAHTQTEERITLILPSWLLSSSTDFYDLLLKKNSLERSKWLNLALEPDFFLQQFIRGKCDFTSVLKFLQLRWFPDSIFAHHGLRAGTCDAAAPQCLHLGSLKFQICSEACVAAGIFVHSCVALLSATESLIELYKQKNVVFCSFTAIRVRFCASLCGFSPDYWLLMIALCFM